MNTKRPLGITIFGIVNIIIGLVNLFVLFIPFLLFVLLGEGAGIDIKRFTFDILDTLAWIILYVSSLCLFWSGIALLRMKKYGRKLAVVASSAVVFSMFIWILSAIISSIVYRKMNLNIESPWHIIFLSFLLYTILLITYFKDPEIKKYFNTKNTQEA